MEILTYFVALQFLSYSFSVQHVYSVQVYVLQVVCYRIYNCRNIFFNLDFPNCTL